MKLRTFISIFFLFNLLCYSQEQDELRDKYKESVEVALKEYNSKEKDDGGNWVWVLKDNSKQKKVIQDKLLKEHLSKAFSQVIFSSSDLSTNTSAFGYAQNKDNTNVTVNTNFKLNKNNLKTYLKAGAYTSGSDNIFEFYGEGSWRNSTGVNIGVIRKVRKGSMFFTGESFLDNHKRRTIYAKEPLYNEKYSERSYKSITNMLDSLEMFTSADSLLKNNDTLLNYMPQVKKYIKEHDYEKAYKALTQEKNKVEKYRDANDLDNLDAYVKNNVLYEFDKKNDETYGYSFKWVDFSVSLGNASYNFTEESLQGILVGDFQSVFDLSDNNNTLKSVISLSFNRTHNSRKKIWYYQFGLSTRSGSYLENDFIKGTPVITKNTAGDFVLQDENGRELGLFENVNKSMNIGMFNAYGAIFFAENKTFGFNASLQHQYLINKPADSYFKNNFSFFVGPIFRKVKDDATSLTFGVDVGWDNALYGTKIVDDFSGRIRVGIPFNIYKKK